MQGIFFIPADSLMWSCRLHPTLRKKATFTNTERRIQRLYQVLEPQEGTKPDWQIIHHLLQALPDREILDALKGALSSSDFILEAVVETAN
jgi:Uncharacterized anaerobic dehydrogenase